MTENGRPTFPPSFLTAAASQPARGLNVRWFVRTDGDGDDDGDGDGPSLALATVPSALRSVGRSASVLAWSEPAMAYSLARSVFPQCWWLFLS